MRRKTRYAAVSIVLFGFFIFSGCGGSSADKTKPALSSTSPASGAANVLVDSNVSATFSKGVNIDSFSLISESGVNRIGATSGSGGSVISFSPSRPLNYGTKYTAKITNIRDGAGNKMADVSWSFTTVASAPLTYHKTPDSTLNDIGRHNSIVPSQSNGNISYITYYNGGPLSSPTGTCTSRSLCIIISTITPDGGNTFSDPYQVAGPSGTERAGLYASNLLLERLSDGSERFHVAYYHEGAGLRYATATTANITAWTVQTVDAGVSTPMPLEEGGTFPFKALTSIALDSSGRVHISYYDAANTALKYATNAGGAWVDHTIDTGLAGENPGLYSSVKVDRFGAVHISYYDSVLGNLKYYNSHPPFGPQISTPDSTGDVGEFSSLPHVDEEGRVYIYYNHVSAADKKRRIRCITNASGFWIHANITEVSGLTSNPIFIDSHGIWHLSYYSGGVLYYRSGVLLDPLLNVWEWSAQRTVDNSGIGNGIYASIMADAGGKARISYHDVSHILSGVVSGDLKFAK